MHTTESPAPHASRADTDVDRREKQKELAKQREFVAHWQKKLMENARLATSLAKAALVDAKGTRWQDATRSTVDYIHSLDMRIGNTLNLGFRAEGPEGSIGGGVGRISEQVDGGGESS